MGTWQCYCALCSGPLQDYRRERRAHAEPDESFSGECYNPDLIRESEWLDRVRFLGLNPESKEPYISGYSEPAEYGHVWMGKGDDPNEPEDITDKRAYEDDEDDGQVFPFHDMCYDILTDIILGASDSKDRDAVDRFVLYHAMSRFVDDQAVTLDIDCVRVSGAGQCWEENEGDEYTVAKPAFLHDAKAAIVSKLSDGSLAPRDISGITWPRRTTSDPFRTLPQDVMFYLTWFLSAKDVLSLSTASWPFLAATVSTTSLWKSLLHLEMAWVGDKIDELIDETAFTERAQEQTMSQHKSRPKRDDESSKPKAVGLDYKRFMLWLDHVVKPASGVVAPWVCLANRRRIWRVCRVVANKYWDVMGEIRGGDYQDRMHEWLDSMLGEKYQCV